MALIEGGNGADTLDGTPSGATTNDIIKGYNGNDTLSGLDGDDILDGGAGNDLLNAGTGDDLLLGGIGLDTLAGGDGNNRLDGGAGADTMTGGLGNDTYIVDSAADRVVEAFGEGVDLVEASVSFTLSADVNNLTLTGITALSGTGNALDNSLTGNGGANRLVGLGGNDTLDGGFGADQMTGGLGDDIYIVDNKIDRVTELAGEGTDEVYAFVSHTLSANVENLFLSGFSVITGTGNALDNTITGNLQVNTLDGGLGADDLQGGGGNDTYIVDNAGDIVADSSGNDTVRSSISFDLSTNAANIESLVLTGTAALDGTGDADDNTITGNTAVNTLDGAAGNDTLIGGAGADVMIGGADDDTYYVDNAGDMLSEITGEGNDSAFSSVTFNLTTNGDEVENLTLTGTAAISGTGNAGDNVLTGNKGGNTLTGLAGNDTLDGGLGNDVLIGGADDDVYVVNALIGKTIIELAGGGIDEVRATVNHTLAAEVDNLVLIGIGNLNGTGNALDNSLTGTIGNNTLNGLAGADTMIGLGGNDVFIVDNAGDDVTGTGLVMSSVTRDLNVNTTLASNLTLTGTAAIDGTGTNAENIITGNTAVNNLAGLDGNDVFFVDASDIVDGGNGSDTVVVNFTASTGYANWTDIENITLTGMTLLNATGDGGDNTLIGNSAKNTLDGGLGDDTYGITTGDVILDTGGNDTVRVGATYTLLAGMENITLTGTGNFNATGDAGINILSGNSGKNTLDGRGGDDTLQGGLGDDTYIVDGSLVTINENALGGIDTVRTAFTHILTSEVEKLVLTGTADIDGTGNGVANTLTGNSGDNTLDGGLGADIMLGGGGNDVFLVDDLNDRATDTGGIDLVIATDIGHTLGLGVENLTLLGSASVNGFGNNLRNVLTGNDGANTLDGGLGSDTMAGGLGGDFYFIDSAGDVVIESIGGGIDTVTSTVNYTLSQDVDNLVLTGEVLSLIGTGNALDNVITGSAGNNRLYGRDGNDTINGGLGDDIIYGELGGDTLNGGVGRDQLYGGDGQDVFSFDATAFAELLDIVRDYSLAQNDVIDVSALVGAAYDPLIHNASDFVYHGSRGGVSYVFVDTDGLANGVNWVPVAQLTGIHPIINQTAVLFQLEP
ncbi:MAG: calcium-binding protein [bacterium]|nr:calcium-binding protein [bacterium]